ncbi:MAG TPA: TRAP transporter small permease subunit [Alphaproteobacteria bacterium]|nr:TRAP transporter small permease subunit [Alphaproteobacteria bacterium]
MTQLLALSDAIDGVLDRIAKASGWIYFALIGVICWDIITRKVGFQIPGFGSTPIQELEWHLHGMLFMFWLGYAYVRNVHVRIDVFTAGLPARRLAWLEVLGVFLFAIPYCIVATWFAFEFAHLSFVQNESSDAPNGLPYRWIIKGFLFLGLMLLCASVISVLFRRLVFLFGSGELAARAMPSSSAN